MLIPIIPTAAGALGSRRRRCAIIHRTFFGADRLTWRLAMQRSQARTRGAGAGHGYADAVPNCGTPLTACRLPSRDSDPAWDSTDAPRWTSYPHQSGYIPWTLLTGFGDLTDATRSYPEDSADEANK